MIILIATLFIKLAVFANSSDSPKRLSTQVHSADGPASTSGRKFEKIELADILESQDQKFISAVFSRIHNYDEKGIFYEENGHYYPVKRGIPLLRSRGYIVGRPKNGIVHPIFNSDHKRVYAAEDNYNLQACLSTPNAFRAGEPIPSHYSVVYPYVPQNPKLKVQSSASAEKSEKRHFKLKN